jgi:hypothetical protein
VSLRLLRIIAPLLALVTAYFGCVQLYSAFYAARLHNWPFTAFYTLFGGGGLILSYTLWRTRNGAQ